MKKIFNVMLTVVACTVIFGFSGCKITATPVPEANYKITYVSAENQSLLPSSKTVKEGYKLTAEDLPNLEVGLDTEAVEDDVYCNWDKEIGDVVSGDITITGTWEDIVCLDYSSNSITADFLMQIMKGSVPSELSSATEHEYYFVKNHTPSDPGKVYDCANTSSNQNYFTIAYEISGTTAKIYVSGNGHRIYAPVNSSKMFYNNTKVTSIDFSNLFTSNVTNMAEMFNNCKNLETLDVSSFDTSNVTTMATMFSGCGKLKKLDLSSFNTEKTYVFRAMFQNCTELTELDLSTFDTSGITGVMGIGNNFTGCSSLKTIYASAKFDISAYSTLPLFDGCTSLVGGAGTKYSDAETADPDNYKTATYARIDGGSSNPGYFTAKN